MCGRFALYSDPFVLAKRFEADALSELRPRYNIAPTQTIAIGPAQDALRRPDGA